MAAEALLPWENVRDFLSSKGEVGTVTDFSAVISVARKFHVSLSAVVLRLIDCKRANWSLWS